MTPEEAPGVTEENQIDDLLMQIEKCKSSICSSPVLPESSSGGTEIMAFKMNLGDISTREETTTLES